MALSHLFHLLCSISFLHADLSTSTRSMPIHLGFSSLPAFVPIRSLAPTISLYCHLTHVTSFCAILAMFSSVTESWHFRVRVCSPHLRTLPQIQGQKPNNFCICALASVLPLHFTKESMKHNSCVTSIQVRGRTLKRGTDQLGICCAHIREAQPYGMIRHVLVYLAAGASRHILSLNGALGTKRP
jgi:hypothetical protein